METVESVVERLLKAKEYPDKNTVVFFYSRYNTKDLFERARSLITSKQINFQVFPRERRIFSNKLRLYFIPEIEMIKGSNDVDVFFYDEPEFINSRTYIYQVRPCLVYRYGTAVEIK